MGDCVLLQRWKRGRVETIQQANRKRVLGPSAKTQADSEWGTGRYTVPHLHFAREHLCSAVGALDFPCRMFICVPL